MKEKQEGASVAPVAPTSGLDLQLVQIARLMDEQIHLQKVALLEPGSILRFFAGNGQEIAIALPQAQTDYLQRIILRNHTFYEAALLAEVQATLRIGPQSVICDAGANIGNHTLYFSRVLGAGKVIAVEPQDHVHATLLRNIGLNGLQDRVVAHRVMLGASPGSGEMAKFNPRNLGATAFRPGQGDVPMVTLDTLIQGEDRERLDLIKIDVEGMQQAVLEGGEAILRARHPPLWVEILAKEPTGPETIAWLSGFGYKARKLSPNDYLFQV